MSLFSVSNIQIIGVSAAVPEYSEGKKDFLQKYSENEVDKVMQSTGIHRIHIQDPNASTQTAGDLGYTAAVHLLDMMDIDRSEIGILMFVSYATDYLKPGTSSVLHMRLGLSDECMATDIGQACAGFVYGHQLMESMLSCSDKKLGLLILADTGNRLVSRYDHTSMMLGDAGTAVLYKKDGGQKHTTILKASGSDYRNIIIPAGGFRDKNASREEILCRDDIIRTPYDLYMDGMSVLSFSTNTVLDTIEEYLDIISKDKNFFDTFVFHQANIFIINRLAKKLGIPMEKVPISLDQYGNTSCASIPLTLCVRYGDDIDNKPEQILVSGFGIGLAWGVTSFEINPSNVFQVIETSDKFDEGKIDIRSL